MRVLIGDHELKIFIHEFIGETAKAFAFLERQLEHGTAQMLKQDQQMIWVDQCLLGRTAEEIIGMMREELVKRIGRGDHDRHCGIISAPRPTRLLAHACDGARIPDDDRRAQPADVNSQFKGIGCHDSFDRAVAQALFDLAALVREVAGAITAD